MRYGILGPLVVWTHGTEHSIKSVRDRTVLALLLVNANRVVAESELIDAVWPDTPPPSVRGQVHGCIFRLRRLLPPGALHTRPHGYLLDVPDDELDALLFGGMAASGHAAIMDGRPAEGSRLLRRALALWRGYALASVDSQALRTAAAGLDELRSAAWEECIDAELLLGREHELIGELTTMVGRHPLRERPRRQLMLALYRAGRQSDALAVYRDARIIFADQLGTEPSPELDGLHRRILNRDPGLHPPTRPGPPSPVTVEPVAPDPRATAPRSSAPALRPAQLPLDVRGFTGRVAELRRLDAVLEDGAGQSTAMPTVVISGTAGVGKTALAVHWAYRSMARFPDGQLYVNLRGFAPDEPALTPADAIRGFLDALGVAPRARHSDLEAQVALYRSSLAGQRMLVLLDNARDVQQVRPLLPGAPGCVVLVTSRNLLPGLHALEGAHLLELDLLRPAEARDMLSRRLGEARVAAEPEAVDRIITTCARLPLALAIAGARALAQPQFPLKILADRLRDAGRALDGLADEGASDLRAAFSWSYRALNPQSAQLFRLLGLHPGPHVTPEALASLAGVSIDDSNRMLATLTRACLVTEQIPGEFAFHDLLRAYAIELSRQIDPDGEREAARARLYDHYLYTATRSGLFLQLHRSSAAIPPLPAGIICIEFNDHQDAYDWFTAEHPVLLNIIADAAVGGFDSHVWRLAQVTAEYCYYHGHRQDLTTANGLALRAASRVGDRTGQAYAHRGLAGAAMSSGRPEQAGEHLRSALALFTEVDDAVGQALIHRNIALVLEAVGDIAGAQDHIDEALALYKVTDDQAGQARTLDEKGWYSALLGDFPEALAACLQSLSWYDRLDDPHGEAGTWLSLGYIHWHTGNHAGAEASYQRALELYRRTGDLTDEAAALTGLGDAREAAGDASGARESWRLALDILDRIEDPTAQTVRDRLHASAPVPGPPKPDTR
jgi:DNA-binding SARP family transcriptional activator/tetratricopeptide (TPR) repeat protein